MGLPYDQIDAILSLVPEMALPRLTFGTLCEDQETGKRVRVVGHYMNSHRKHKIMTCATSTDVNLLKTVEVEQEGDDGTLSDFVDISMARLKPLFMQSPELSKKISKGSSIFMNVGLVSMLA